MMSAAIGIIGGSGVSGFEGLEDVEERRVETPFGDPSDVLVGGIFEGRKVWFLSRHGQNHTILPTEVNHRANFWARHRHANHAHGAHLKSMRLRMCPAQASHWPCRRPLVLYRWCLGRLCMV